MMVRFLPVNARNGNLRMVACFCILLLDGFSLLFSSLPKYSTSPLVLSYSGSAINSDLTYLGLFHVSLLPYLPVIFAFVSWVSYVN